MRFSRFFSHLIVGEGDVFTRFFGALTLAFCASALLDITRLSTNALCLSFLPPDIRSPTRQHETIWGHMPPGTPDIRPNVIGKKITTIESFAKFHNTRVQNFKVQLQKSSWEIAGEYISGVYPDPVCTQPVCKGNAVVITWASVQQCRRYCAIYQHHGSAETIPSQRCFHPFHGLEISR